MGTAASSSTNSMDFVNRSGSTTRTSTASGNGTNKNEVPECKFNPQINAFVTVQHLKNNPLCLNNIYYIFFKIAYRVGHLPKYLKDMKVQKEEKNRLAAEIDPNCPVGHIALNDFERIEALAIAHQSNHIILSFLFISFLTAFHSI